MQWSEVVNNPYFENLPFKIELNRYGKIEMTPASNKHGSLQLHIGALLDRKLKQGEALTESSIETTEGVKVAGVVWCSKAFINLYGYQAPYPKAPRFAWNCFPIKFARRNGQQSPTLLTNRGRRSLGGMGLWIITAKPGGLKNRLMV